MTLLQCNNSKVSHKFKWILTISLALLGHVLFTGHCPGQKYELYATNHLRKAPLLRTVYWKPTKQKLQFDVIAQILAELVQPMKAVADTKPTIMATFDQHITKAHKVNDSQSKANALQWPDLCATRLGGEILKLYSSNSRFKPLGSLESSKPLLRSSIQSRDLMLCQSAISR